MTSSVEALFNEYTRLYSERDVEGVTNLCLWPFLAIRKGEAIHLPDRDAVRDHFANAIIAYRVTSGVLTWTAIESRRPANLASIPSSRHCIGMRSMRTGNCAETPIRATTCSPLRTAGASSPIRITSETSRP